MFVTEFNARVNWIRPATRVEDKPGNPPTKFLCYILDFHKNVMLIYVSCEPPEQITDYLYFKLRSLVSAWFSLFAIVVLCRT